MADPRARQIVAVYPEAATIAEQIVALSDRLGLADPASLANMVYFESNFSPTAYNRKTGATGLIQFMPTTATGLGTSTTALKGMSAAQQWAYVEKYLLKFAGKIRAPVDLYMAVFYPRAMGNPDFKFPEKVVAANAGIRTPRDYERMASAKARLKFTSRSELSNAPASVLVASPPTRAAPWQWWAAGTAVIVGAVIFWRRRARGRLLGGKGRAI